MAGALVGSSGNVIVIGSPGDDVDNSGFIVNIRGVQTHSAGQLGTANSSQRYKKEIKRMKKPSKSILALKPVTFHYKNDASQFGLIAEEVAMATTNCCLAQALHLLGAPGKKS